MRHPSRFLKNLFGSANKPRRARLQLGNLEDRTVPSGSDVFATATVIAPGSLPYSDSGDTTLATGEVGETALDGAINSHWYRFTPTITGTYQIDTIGSSYDTYIGITTDTSVNGVTYFAQDDDSGGFPLSLMNVPLLAGTTYRIAVDGFNANAGAYTLNIAYVSPVNDNFVNATALPSAVTATAVGSALLASVEANEPAVYPGASVPLNTLWWTWTAPATGTVTVDTLGSNFDTTLEAFTGTSLASLVSVAANDDINFPINPESTISFVASAGTTYSLRVDGFSNGTGNVVLNLVQDAPTLDITPTSTNAVRNETVEFTLDNLFAPNGNTDQPFEITVSWGDASPDTVITGITDLSIPSSYTVSHAWSTVGAKTVTVTIEDAEGDFSTTTATVNVTVARVDGGGNLLIGGTDADDQIVIDQGVSPNALSTNLRAYVNGQYQGTFGVPGPGVTAITGSVRVFGGLGMDTMTLIGRSGADIFTLADGTPVPAESDRFFDLNGREYTTLATENFVFKGLDGNDQFIVDYLDTTSTVSIESGNGNDSLIAGTGLDDVDDLGGDGAQWNILGPQRGTLETSLRFSTVENIIANGVDDTFVVAIGGAMTNVGTTHAIDAGAGENVVSFASHTSGFNYTVTSAGVLNTSAGRIAGVDVLLASTLGNDRFTGATMPALAANAWEMIGLNAGTYTGGANDPINFAGVDSLTGGANVDTFTFTGGSLTGSLDGGAGVDVIDYDTFGGPVTTSLAPAKTEFVGGTWASIESFIAGTGNNTFKGNNSANTWNLTGTGTGTLNTTLSFSNYANLVGGTSTDKFDVGAAADFTSLSGGTGGVDTLNYLNYGAHINVDLTSNNNTGTVDATLNFTGIDSLIGANGVGSDTLSGTAAGDAIVISAQRTGKINNVLTFNNFETLVGEGGNDKYTVTTTFPLGMMSIDGGGEATGDTLIAPNQPNTWTLTGTGEGTVMGTGDIPANALDFTGIEHLTGGSGIDTFDFTGGDIAGSLVVGSGNDILSVGTNDVTLTTATAGTVAVIGGTFTSIESLIATGPATLFGANIANTWKLTGSNTGKLNAALAFAGFDSIVGGSMADKLQLSTGTLTGGFNGNGGTDTLDYSGVAMLRAYVFNPVGQTSARDGMGGMLTIANMELISGNL